MNQINDTFTELTFISLHCLLFLINFKIMNRKIMHPAVLFSALWLFVLILHFIFGLTILNQLFPIRISTYLIFFIGTMSFSFGSLIQTMIRQKIIRSKNKVEENSQPHETIISLNLRYILVAIVVLGLPFYISAAYRLFLASNYENFFIGLRTELSYGEGDMGMSKYLFPFSMVVYTLNLYSFLREKKRANKTLFIISLISIIIYTIFFTGRTPFLFILVLYLGMNYFYNKNFSLKKLSRLFVIFIIIFIFFGVVYGKGGNTDSTAQENFKPAAEATAIYMVGGLNALDWELSHQYRVSYDGYNSLRFFIKIGEQLDLWPNIKVNKLIMSFVFIPYPTNVYTVYSFYIKDFGKIYAWMIMAFFGFFQTYVYYKALEKKNIRFSICYSFLLFPMLMSFFADQYFSLISYWLQVAVFIEGIIFLNKFFISKKW